MYKYPIWNDMKLGTEEFLTSAYLSHFSRWGPPHPTLPIWARKAYSEAVFLGIVWEKMASFKKKYVQKSDRFI